MSDETVTSPKSLPWWSWSWLIWREFFYVSVVLDPPRRGILPRPALPSVSVSLPHSVLFSPRFERLYGLPKDKLHWQEKEASPFRRWHTEETVAKLWVGRHRKTGSTNNGWKSRCSKPQKDSTNEAQRRLKQRKKSFFSSAHWPTSKSVYRVSHEWRKNPKGMSSSSECPKIGSSQFFAPIECGGKPLVGGWDLSWVFEKR